VWSEKGRGSREGGRKDQKCHWKKRCRKKVFFESIKGLQKRRQKKGGIRDLKLCGPRRIQTRSRKQSVWEKPKDSSSEVKIGNVKEKLSEGEQSQKERKTKKKKEKRKKQGNRPERTEKASEGKRRIRNVEGSRKSRSRGFSP